MATDPAWTDAPDADGGLRENAEARLLMARIRDGDHDAARAFFERYFDRVYTYARSALGHSADAEDVTQQVFIKALRALVRDEADVSSVRAWLFVIAKHQLVDFQRGRDRVRVVAPADMVEHVERAGSVPDLAGPMPVGSWDRLVAPLCDRHRQVLTLRYRCDLTTSEIAQVLNLSEQAIHKIDQRARAILEARLVDRSRPGRVLRVPMQRRAPGLPVLRARRMALVAA